MKTIYKYPLAVKDVQYIEMPYGAEILTVQTQNETPYIWALVDTEAEKDVRLIVTVGTGNPFTWLDFKYIGTYQLQDGALVFHVFEAGLITPTRS